MFERISLKLVELFSELKREEGQGATEYAMIIVFLLIILGMSASAPLAAASTRSSPASGTELEGLIP